METGYIRKCLENTIQHLEKIKLELTEENEHNFEIESKLERSVNPLFIGLDPVRFEQNGPVTFHLIIKDHRNTGKSL
jgi:hypothetical protein